MTAKEIGLLWNVNERTVRRYCEKEYILGAEKKDGQWVIPDNYPQPYISGKKKFRSPSEKSNYVLSAIASGKALDFRLLALRQQEFYGYAEKLIAAGLAERTGGKYQITQSGLDRCEEIRRKKRSDVTQTAATVISAVGQIVGFMQMAN